jgi:hypothetical protein
MPALRFVWLSAISMRFDLTSRRDFFKTRGRLEPGSGQEAFLPKLSSPFSDLQCQGSTHRGQTKKGKINMKLQNLIHILIVLVCFGLAPMAQAVGPDTDGNIPGSNNGEGIGVLVSRTTGIWNTGTGFEALKHLTAGNQNTATGLRALTNDINGGFNTATGILSLFSNTSGFFNSATGGYSLAHNTDGNNNTANGYGALYFNDADNNTATGFAALHKNTTGSDNNAVGASALVNNFSGIQNEAMGSLALSSNVVGSFNVAIGDSALNNADSVFNTAVGFDAGQNLTTGFDNIYIGDTAGTLDNTGASPGDESGVIRIGSIFSGTAACFINGIATNAQVWNGVTVCQVTVNGFGQLGVDCVNPNNPGATPASPGAPVPHSAPQPRSAPQQPAARPQFQAMNDKVEKLQATVAQQQKQIETLTAQLKEQAAQIQKVSAQLEASKPAPQVVKHP